ncbi:MAG: CocE/NonD family hydrolase, partial [Pseudomonadota bacterium]
MNLVLKHSILKIMILASFVFVIFASKLSAQDFPPGVSESGPFDVKVTKDIMVPMRDGVKLATDLYAPASSTGKLPTVIIRLPYIKDTYTTAVSAANYIASHGFNVAVQDMRGRGKSEGQFLVFGNERRDGYDFIDWIIRQPWSTDRVGSYGCSYLGENQILLAAEKHPNHKAMIAQAAGGAIGSLDDSYKYFAAYNG